MAVQEQSPTQSRLPVLVYLGGDHAVEQPASFRCCPLGVQFCSREQVGQYDIVDVKVRVPQGAGMTDEVSCSGIVVRCERETDPAMFRVVIYFLDPPEAVRNHLHSIAKDSDLLCPYCANF